MPVLSILLFCPLIGILALSVSSKYFAKRYAWLIALCIFSLQFVICLYLYLNISDLGSECVYGQQFYFLERNNWVSVKLYNNFWFSINYFLGIDAISLCFVMLTSLIFFIVTLISRYISNNTRAYYNLIMVTSMAIMGVFLALDMFLFFLFYELMLFPLFFLIAVWGSNNSLASAIKFFVFTFTGSLFILVAIILVGMQSYSLLSTDIFSLTELLKLSSVNNSKEIVAVFCFILFMIGFGVKVPIFPLHLWLPKAHTSAPTPVSIILAAVSLKVGIYGILRFAISLFPTIAHDYAIYIVSLSIFSMFYASLNAYSAKDLKEVVAWSSISHMSIVLIGLFTFHPEGMSAAVLYAISHGLLSVLLFILPHILYIRTANRLVYNFSGLIHLMPKYVFFSVLTLFVGLALPGFGLFIAEFLVFASLVKFFITQNISIFYILILALAVFVGILYWLKIIKNMLLGQLHLSAPSWKPKLVDINFGESFLFIFVLLTLCILGVYPNLVFNLTNKVIVLLYEHLN